MTEDPNLPILIAGAGPVGLFAALRLAQAGINSIVLEKGSTLGDLPRATGYYGASLVAFQKAGVLEKMRTRGFSAAVSVGASHSVMMVTAARNLAKC